MKNYPLLLPFMLGLTALAAEPTPADTHARVQTEVLFPNSEKFTDVLDSPQGTAKGREAILALLSEHLIDRTRGLLPEGWKLTVTLTDVDLAGNFEPAGDPRFDDIRIVKGIYPPRIDLEFKVVDANGKVMKEGKRELRDLAFQNKISLTRDDPYHYEKELLDDWVRQEFPRIKKT